METNDSDERQPSVQVDVSNVSSSWELHYLLKTSFGFPGFYGMNWHAFWDAITGLVEMPHKIIFVGWSNLVQRLPEDAMNLRRLLEKLNEMYPDWGSELEFVL